MLPRHVPLPNPVNATSLRHNNLHSTVITLTDTGVWGCWKHDRKKKWQQIPGTRARGWRQAADTQRGRERTFLFFFCLFFSASKSFLENENMHFGVPYCCGGAPSFYQLWGQKERKKKRGKAPGWLSHTQTDKPTFTAGTLSVTFVFDLHSCGYISA